MFFLCALCGENFGRCSVSLLSLEKFGIKFGLANIRTLCTALGEPQDAFRSVLIAGTNGKGSVTAMVDRGLRAAGLKVGRYTSPHLIHLEERFTIDGQPVDRATLVEAIERVRGLVESLLAAGALDAPPTFFEVTTAMAFDMFRRAGVEFAVLEVGLGGRLDSTNCVEPIACAITSIAFDHEQYLGHTLAAIAAEKAGVIRSGIPVVIGPLDPEARAVVASMSAAAGARLVDAQDGVEVGAGTLSRPTSITLKTPMHDYGRITLGLRGAHQVPNALVALRLLEELSRVAPVSADAIVSGLRDVEWRGRLQLVEAPGGRQVLLDAAHNPAGAAALAAYLSRGNFRSRCRSCLARCATRTRPRCCGFFFRSRRCWWPPSPATRAPGPRRSWRSWRAPSRPAAASRWNRIRWPRSNAHGRTGRSSARRARFS